MADTIIDVVLRLKDSFSKGLDNAASSAKGFQGKMEGLSKSLAGVSIASAAALGGSIKLAADWQKSIDGAARSLDLSGDALKKFGKEAETLTAKLNFQKSSTEIATLAADIGKLGVATEDIFKYTEAVTKVAIATDKLDKVDEMAVDLAKIGGNFKLSTEEVEKFGAALNKLDDSGSVTSDQLLNFSRRMSAFAPAMGISEKATLAWGSTLVGAGMEVETAANFMKNFTNRLAAVNTLSKPASAALEKMGYNLKNLQQDFLKKPNETLITFIERMKTLPKAQQFDTIVQVFGQEWAAAFLNASGNLDVLKKNLQLAGDDAGNLKKLTDEANGMSQSFQGMTRSFQNQIGEIGKQIGLILLPSINQLLKDLSPLLNKVVQFTQTHPEITKWVVAALGIGAVAAPIAAVVAGIGGFIAIIPAIAAGLGVISAAALPIAAVVAAIAAVAAGAYLIHKNWEPIKKFFADIWLGMTYSVNQFGNNFKNWANNLHSTIGKQFDQIGNRISSSIEYGINGAVNSVKSFVDWIWNLGANFANAAKNWGTGLINGFVDGIQSNIARAQSAVSNFTSGIAKYLPQSDAEKGALSQLTASGKSLVDTFFKGVNAAGLNERLTNLLSNPFGESVGLSPAYATATGRQPSTINIEMPITIQGNVTQDVINQLRKRDRELIQVISDANRRLGR